MADHDVPNTSHPGHARRWGDLTWEELSQHPCERLVAILPVGATEAHGPHLPLATDVIIAEAMAEAACERLAEAGLHPLVLPPLAYSVADYAAGFIGTVTISAATATVLIVDIARSLSAHGIPVLALANAHLDPAHIGSLAAVAEQCTASGCSTTIVFPDITRKPWALRLTDEFKSGACHAGQYEGSIVLAKRPDLVREDTRKSLPPNPRSLSQAIRSGHTSFEAAGGPRAYFGDPAAATAAEGHETIAILGDLLAQAVLDHRGAQLSPAKL